MNFYFFYQRAGKESAWDLALATERDKIVEEVKPAFLTALDLSGVPDDNDWAKVRYIGPLYFDFDADGDLDLVCAQFRLFLGKLTTEVGFDLAQGRYYASGSKGFHVEIPQACFIAKPPAQGYTWLPYIYREMAQKLMVDTLDLSVYTGKRGRQWRTVNVKRENGCYKVPLTWEEAFEITPEGYREIIQAPRTVDEAQPPSIHPQFSMMFEAAKDKVIQVMRGRKKRVEKANEFLDPYRKANRHPPTIERMMAGEGLNPGVGFQAIAMQMAIYATSVGMGLDEFLRRCEGLCEKHVSDGWRYGTVERRRNELTRMWEYMGENTLYDFEVGPLQRMLDASVQAHDLGIITPEQEEKPAPKPAAAPVAAGDEPPPDDVSDSDDDSGEGQPALPGIDVHGTFRRGVFHNSSGLFVKVNGEVKSLCRASFKEVVSLFRGEPPYDSMGFEAEMRVGTKTKRVVLSLDAFRSSVGMKTALSAHLIPYQGADAETAALFDIVIAKSEASGSRIYTFPREGLSVLRHPETNEMVVVYLTQDVYRCSIPEDDPRYFRLRYHAEMAMSAYNIDIHKAPPLDASHEPTIRAMLSFNKPDVVGAMVGWFVAAHFRSAYLATLNQFPLLHVFGEAGSGKTQTVSALAHLHWHSSDLISVKSAAANTDFALENAASTSASAPLILDEYKPREMKVKGRHQKLKDIFKANYVASEVTNKGTVNKGAANGLTIVKARGTAPIVFMAEAMEVETAIVERIVPVALSKSFITPDRRRAFQAMQANPAALSAIGRCLVDLGPYINFERMGQEVRTIRDELFANQPCKPDGTPLIADRMIFNRSVVIHGLVTLRALLRRHFENRFDSAIDELISTQRDLTQVGSDVRGAGISEITKFMNRVAALTMVPDRPYSVVKNLDYLMHKELGYLELRVEKAYDCYRLWCAQIAEAPLFDQFDALASALQVYTPVLDLQCASSVLRGIEGENNEMVVRFDLERLQQAGGRNFRA